MQFQRFSRFTVLYLIIPIICGHDYGASKYWRVGDERPGGGPRRRRARTARSLRTAAAISRWTASWRSWAELLAGVASMIADTTPDASGKLANVGGVSIPRPRCINGAYGLAGRRRCSNATKSVVERRPKLTRLPGSKSLILATVSWLAGESEDAGSGNNCKDSQETSWRRKVDPLNGPGARHLAQYGSQDVARREGGAPL